MSFLSPNRPLDFTRLYDQHVEQIYRYHLARTGCIADAEDLTAETFHAALQSFGRYDSRSGPPIGWLVGIARHKWMDHLRRSGRSVPLESIADRPGLDPSPEDQAGYRLEVTRLSQVLAQLNPDRAEALALHYFAGLTMAETGRAMGKSEDAVKKLVQRGLAELRDRLGLKPAAVMEKTRGTT